MIGDCIYCGAKQVPCDVFDHASPDVRRFWLCQEQCSPVFQKSWPIKEYMMACVLFTKVPTENNDAVRDTLWLDLDAEEMDAINAIKYHEEALE